MNKLSISTVFLLLFITALSAFSAEAATRSRGYYKPSTGTYVQPYYRSSPNSTRYDNYSTQGNYNPFTGNPRTERAEQSSYDGKKGYANPYKSYRFR